MKKILVIEDEVAVRESIQEILILENFEAVMADQGQSGLQLAKQELPDLIICDVMMSNLNGYDVLKALRLDVSTAAIPFIFLTAKADKTDFRYGMNLGADDYLTKPFTPTDLVDAIASRLNKQTTTASHYIDIGQCPPSADQRQFNDTEKQLTADLDQAIQRKELQVYYQPQVNLQNQEITGAEALLRWHHPKQGWISPATFIPLAEASGLIIPLGSWVMRQACQQVKVWRQHYAMPLTMAVNLSACQFHQTELGETVPQLLVDIGLPPEALELELTESMLMHDQARAIATLSQLKSTGVQIAIDDFGTGYSSLNYIHEFPCTTLKIDRGFVQNLLHSEKSRAITQLILKMAQQLNFHVVAEGIETEYELTFFKQHFCHTGQGFLFSRPLAADGFEALLAKS